MRLSRKAEYAIRALTAMARRPPDATSQIDEIAAAEHIPVKFLEQILLVLRRSGLLRSRRGVGGGYQLALPADRISLADIILPIDGPFEPIPCTSESARKTGRCPCGTPGCGGIGAFFRSLQDTVNDQLNSTTLADIARTDAENSSVHFDI
jgi:Rrf2 family protein